VLALPFAIFNKVTECLTHGACLFAISVQVANITRGIFSREPNAGGSMFRMVSNPRWFSQHSAVSLLNKWYNARQARKESKPLSIKIPYVWLFIR